ncbi:MAG: efflux RND transporter permease subunit [Chitinophagales bacterium]
MSSLSSTSIDRPVLSIVMSLMLVLLGVVGFYFLGVREYPAVDPPTVTVTTTYIGANADIIESQITEPLEEALNGIDGIRTISSTSKEQSSSIVVEFNIDENLEKATNDVRDRVSRAVRNLPRDVEPPVVEKADANSEPIIFMTLRSDTRDIMDVNAIATNVVKERLQTISGVSFVRIFGEKKYSMRLWMDPSKMVAFGVTPMDVQNALDRENIELPSGRIEGNETELSIRTLGKLTKPEEFNHLILKESDGTITRFSDIGFATLGPENERNAVKRNLVPMIGIALVPQPGANAVDISNEFYKRKAQLEKELPEDCKLEVGFDFTTFVRKTITEVQDTVLIAFLLVILIIFLFLRDWRSTIIPVIAIPISIIAAFFIMYVAGFSINVLTLVAIILSIGLVCDDAIVVLENIYAKVEDGQSPIEAAKEGSREIFFAVISTTVTLAAVFFPIMFLTGLTGRLFREFGVVVAGSVLISAFVALTLSPMMSSRMLKHHDKRNWFYRATEPFFTGLNEGYRSSLEAFMSRRWIVFPILGIIAVLVFILMRSVPSELAPYEDRSSIRVSVTGPEGSSYEFTEKYMDELSKYVMDSIPEASSSLSIIAPSFGSIGSVNTGVQSIYLNDPSERKRTVNEVMQQLTRDLKYFTGIRAFPNTPPTIGSRFAGQPLQYVIQSPDLKSLLKVLPEFLDEANKNPKLQFVDADLKVNKPELTLTVNREKSSELGVSVADVAKTLQLSLSGQRMGYFIMEGKQYQVIAQLEKGDRNKPGDLKNIYVRSKEGNMVSLDNLITVEDNTSPAAVYRFNRYVSATISSGIPAGSSLSEGIKAMDEIAAKVLPETFATSLKGQARDFQDSSSSLLFAFLLALLVIYLVLAAQFESFRDPMIIMLTVPAAIAGALLSLWYFDQTLNIFSQIGMIMLIGLITKNGILIVEFANQRKEQGLNKTAAVKDAAVRRFRPILMTTSATLLGILPIALSLGSSASSRQSLGIAVVGGLLFSAFLTLYIVPAMYSYLSKEGIRESVPDPSFHEEKAELIA